MKLNKLQQGIFALFMGGAILFYGCSHPPAPTPSASAPTAPAAPSAPAAPAVNPAQAATITGKVAFQGKAPVMQAVSMSKEPSCNAADKTHPQKEETVAVNPNKTLQYVIVYVKEGLQGKTFPTPPAATFDQKHCWYHPHVLAVMTGQTINVTNSDPGVLHNLHFTPTANAPVNFGQPGPASASAAPTVNPVTFNKPEIIPVQCDVHPWMHGFVGVFDNPYFAVTDAKGEFTIKDLPAGTYTLEAWQEKYGTQTAKVTVKAKQTKSVTFTFKG